MKLLKTFLVITLLTLNCSSSEKIPDIKPISFESNHMTYAKTLATYIKDEKVDYRKLKANRAGLDNFIAQLAGLSSEEYNKMNRNGKMALWINAYNGITLRSIIDAYPVESIKDIDGVWDKKKWLVAGKKVTLNEIEHKILRPEFKDARVHFAVNCASISCPPLPDKPFLSTTLDKQLNNVVRKFVNNPARNIIDADNNKIKTVELFSWYGEDFTFEYATDRYPYLNQTEAAVVNFILSNTDSSLINSLDKTGQWSIEYMDYDWSLNDITR